MYRHAGDHWAVAATYTGNEKVRAEPFDAVELDMTNWWMPGAPTDENAGK